MKNKIVKSHKFPSLLLFFYFMPGKTELWARTFVSKKTKSKLWDKNSKYKFWDVNSELRGKKAKTVRYKLRIVWRKSKLWDINSPKFRNVRFKAANYLYYFILLFCGGNGLPLLF